MKPTYCFLLLIFALVTPAFSAQAAQADETRGELKMTRVKDDHQMPMHENHENSALHHWNNKKVLKSRLVNDVSDKARWSFEGVVGSMDFIAGGGVEGENAVRVTSPTKAPYGEGATVGRPFGQVTLRCKIDGEDWTHFNRLSFWVKPNMPGHRHVSMLLRLYNDGAIKVPYFFNREGSHYFMVEDGKWNHVTLEIPYIPRDKMTSLTFNYRLQGNEPSASETARFDISHIEIQAVDADNYEGWDVAKGKIAYSHTGYLPNAKKTAISTDLSLDTFTIADAASQKVILTKATEKVKTHLGEYRVFDFSELTEEGEYVIQSGPITTRSFRIASNVWDESIWKTINFFYCERCGTEVPGIHGVCHADALFRHEDKTIVANGGWHDAGDLSQGLSNTSDAVTAMCELANSIQHENPALAKRLIEEARWGLDWLLKTRFGGGFRGEWITLDFWTDGIIGTLDDVSAKAGNRSFQQGQAALAEATASISLRNSDPILADYSLKCAKEDLRWALAANDDMSLQTASTLGLAALALSQASGEEEFADHAHDLSKIVLECQQTEPTDWQIPLSGFFYTDTTRKHILHYSHQGYEELPIRFLAGLCAAFPEDPAAKEWRRAVSLHAQYLKRICEFSAPYQMVPASVYEINDSEAPDYNPQVRTGIPLSEKHYLRLFPVWSTHRRGNFGTILSQAKALSTAAQLLEDPELLRLSMNQLEWIVGKNPFCQSTMYGEGYDFPPMFSVCSGDMVGALPVGIMTHLDNDLPYWPQAIGINYKEVWVLPSAKWLSILADVYDARDR